MNPPADFDGFNFAANALTGVDEYSVKYLKHQAQPAQAEEVTASVSDEDWRRSPR